MANSLRKQNFYIFALIAYLACLIASLFIVENHQSMPLFQFHFNSYGLASFAGMVGSLTALTFLLRRQQKTFDNLWLTLSLGFISLFGLTELFQRLSTHAEGAIFWAEISGLSGVFMAACIFLFALNYTKAELRTNLITVVAIVGAAMMSVFEVNSNVIFKITAEHTHLYPWGYNNDIGSAFVVHILWQFSLYFLSIILFIRYRQKTGSKILRQQSTLFAVAISFAVAGGFVFDFMLPLTGQTIFPPLSLLFISFSGVLLTVGVLKFRLSELSPALLSQNILSTMNETVVVTNERFEIELVNEAAGSLFHTRNDRIIRAPLTKFLALKDADLAALQTAISADSSKTLPPIDDVLIRHNDKVTYTRVLASPIVQSHRVEGYIFVISDVTALKKANADLEEAKASVEHTVEVRTRELRQAQKKLLEMDKLKTEFIMLTSHNLRTPLSVINGYLSILKTSKLDDSQQHILESLDVSSQRLGKLVNDLLTISVIESKEEQLTRRPTKASELLWEVVHSVETTAKTNGNDNKFNRHITVGDANIVASPERLRAALGNILENSFKFTRNGEVSLKATIDGNKLIVKISDTGIGIKADELTKLFTKFHRGTDTLEFGYEGGGIGLYLTKLVIDEHEGTIDVQSKEGKGTTTVVTLPLTKQVAEPKTKD